MSLHVPGRFEGAPGRAQGGYTGGLLHDGRPRRVWFRSAIPLDTDLDVDTEGDIWTVTSDGTIVLESHPVEPLTNPLANVSMEDAIAGRVKAEAAGLPDLIAPCYSCGTREGTLRTHPGRVSDGSTWAAPITYPEWTSTDSAVDPAHIWAVIDCAPGYPVAFGDPEPRFAFTGWITVDVRSSIQPGRTAIVVASAGPWEGRKRAAKSALWTEDGELVALSESLWIAAPHQ
jgi:hypothetical protein